MLNFFAPQKRTSSFFWEVLLDSSIMPTGSKVKAAMAIAQKVKYKLDQKALHGVMSLRNAFAHHKVDSHPMLTVGRNPESGQVYYRLQIVSNSGSVSQKRRDHAFAEFNSSYATAKESLEKLLVAIASWSVQNAP